MLKSLHRSHVQIAAALTIVPALLTSAGCGNQTPSPATSTESSTASDIDGTMYLLTAEPESAVDVIQVRKDAADGDDIIIVGRIGGSADPWIKGRAAFSIVDDSLRACSDIEGDGCPIPWDYCCETDKLPGATALVKVVDNEGNLVQAEAKSLLGVKELSTVVVQGKAKRDGDGNLTVLASGIFVRKL